MRMLLLLSLSLCAPLAAEETAEYARPELLIEANTLREALDDRSESLHVSLPDAANVARSITLIDVRPRKDYETGTLPHARWVDANVWSEAFGQGDNTQDWSVRLGQALPSRHSMVVVLDKGVTPTAARIWWILKYWGVKDVRLLNGGLQAWSAAGGELAAPSKFAGSVPLAAKAHPDRLATRSEMMAHLQEPGSSTCLIDTRTSGEVNAGYIPTASHSDWARYVDPDTGRIRTAGELQALLSQAGFRRERPAIAYCRTGGRASLVAFAMELMGGAEVANYFGSWREWRQLPNAPIAKPES